jgi:hypothetical protein
MVRNKSHRNLQSMASNSNPTATQPSDYILDPTVPWSEKFAEFSRNMHSFKQLDSQQRDREHDLVKYVEGMLDYQNVLEKLIDQEAKGVHSFSKKRKHFISEKMELFKLLEHRASELKHLKAEIGPLRDHLRALTVELEVKTKVRLRTTVYMQAFCFAQAHDELKYKLDNARAQIADEISKKQALQSDHAKLVQQTQYVKRIVVSSQWSVNMRLTERRSAHACHFWWWQYTHHRAVVYARRR